ADWPHREVRRAPGDDRANGEPADSGTRPSAGADKAEVQASASFREAAMHETTTARETMTADPALTGTGDDVGPEAIGAANPDGSPVVPSLVPGAAQQELSGIETGLITYVLDTSVLLSDPLSLHRFAEH